MFIGNGGGVELAYDDGEFAVPGKPGKPKRIRFPADAPDPEPKPVVEAKPLVEDVAQGVKEEESLADIVEEIESMEGGAIELEPLMKKKKTRWKAQDFDDDLF